MFEVDMSGIWAKPMASIRKQAKLYKLASTLTPNMALAIVDISNGKQSLVGKAVLLHLAKEGFVQVRRKVTLTAMGESVLPIIKD